MNFEVILDSWLVFAGSYTAGAFALIALFWFAALGDKGTPPRPDKPPEEWRRWRRN